MVDRDKASLSDLLIRLLDVINGIPRLLGSKSVLRHRATERRFLGNKGVVHALVGLDHVGRLFLRETLGISAIAERLFHHADIFAALGATPYSDHRGRVAGDHSVSHKLGVLFAEQARRLDLLVERRALLLDGQAPVALLRQGVLS